MVCPHQSQTLKEVQPAGWNDGPSFLTTSLVNCQVPLIRPRAGKGPGPGRVSHTHTTGLKISLNTGLRPAAPTGPQLSGSWAKSPRETRAQPLSQVPTPQAPPAAPKPRFCYPQSPVMQIIPNLTLGCPQIRCWLPSKPRVQPRVPGQRPTSHDHSGKLRPRLANSLAEALTCSQAASACAWLVP